MRGQIFEWCKINAESGDSYRIPVLQFMWGVFDGFTDNLKSSDNRPLQDWVVQEVFEVDTGEILDQKPSFIKDVMKVVNGWFHIELHAKSVL